MARFTSRAILLAATFAAGSVSIIKAQVQTAAKPDAPATETSPVLAEKPAPASPESTAATKPRAISNELAASLAASMPKFSPPPKEEPKPASSFEEMDEADKPKNSIIRLPQVTVQSDRPPVFRERDVLSQSQQTDLAMKRYAGLGMMPLAGMNRPIAYAMYLEEQRKQDLAEMGDSANLQRQTDPDGADSLKKETDKAFIRTDDWGGYKSGPK